MLTNPIPNPPPRRSSDTTRAVVTVALVGYLVGLVLTIACNSTSGTSPLAGAIKTRLFSPWLTPAWLDLGFDYRLTYGLSEDADHRLEISPHAAGGRPVVRFPADFGGERAARWRRLAASIAAGAEGGDALAVAVGLAGGAALGTDDALLRIVRHRRPARGFPLPEPADETAFAARVRRVDGEPQLIREIPGAEVAPLRAQDRR